MDLGASDDDFRNARKRILIAGTVIACVLAVGTLGFYYLGWSNDLDHWTMGECFYMTAITISTVGFGESLEVHDVAGGQAWTLVLIFLGIGANLWVISSLTSFFLEGDFFQLQRYRRVRKVLDVMENHYIVCGVGSTGRHVASELMAVGHSVVAVDLDAENIERAERAGALPVNGDATDDEVLRQAGIERARGIVATLDDDKTNMFVVVSARQANPRLRIVAKAVSPSAGTKLQHAGADVVVSPNFIGGLRIASELIRPHVVQFLDRMTRGKEEGLRIEEAVVAPDGRLAGKSLAESGIREETGTLVIAVKHADGTTQHAPHGTHVITPGETLIVIGEAPQVKTLRTLVGPA